MDKNTLGVVIIGLLVFEDMRTTYYLKKFHKNDIKDRRMFQFSRILMLIMIAILIVVYWRF